MKTLIVVESPTKARTIKNYLSNDYELFATMGHVKDLAISGDGGFGVEINNGFKAVYETIKGKTTIISKLKEKAQGKNVLLASDLDREGEAIAWHIKEELKLDNGNNRIYFTEITKEAILEAIDNPIKINENLVYSQETRRILDRIIGFDLSKLVQRKIHSTSAGRVQSVALKMIIDREKEITEFIPIKYYLIEADFKIFQASYSKANDKSLVDEAEADQLIKEIGKEFRVKEIEEKEVLKFSPYPFVTSSLQQEAVVKLRMNASSVMRVAQKLYEGVKIGNETVGLITYMRTDSFNLANKFINFTRDYIKKTYGEDYVGAYRQAKNKKGAQEAHEAIRPTSIHRTPESIKAYLTAQEFKLYELIYLRTLAFLMKPGIDLEKEVILEANNHLFNTKFVKEVFPGYRMLYESKSKDNYPDFTLNEVLTADNVAKVEKQTEPKRRYSEATLIRALEESGIGRPSTYAETTKKNVDVGYVRRVKGYFEPTEQGVLTSETLDQYFSDFINVNYTSKMEDLLDEIALGEITKQEVLTGFYNQFKKQVELASKEMPTVKREVTKTGEKCPVCGKDLVYKYNRKGETFIGCSGYADSPRCTFTKSVPK